MKRQDQANPPEWDSIMAALGQWRRGLEQDGPDPAVGLVAEKYRRDPWAVLASTILSLRTKDEVTLAASKALLAAAPSPAALLGLSEDALARLIYPAGFYRTKASNLRKIAGLLLAQYEGAVPKTMEALLALPGVGRKTANLVLIEAFDQDGICVDTHVHRISNRAGWVSAKSPEETEAGLRRLLPRVYWKGINALLVLYGQRVCRPLSPFCSQCAIHPHCARQGVRRSR
ncbi:MAG: endonuclease III [Spirochaetaceae bacterium]|jgi:endonuclease-3|nr:endonuclease III [Spirochaetaceae bacterium]